MRPVDRPGPARRPDVVDPALRHIARTRPSYTNAAVDGRPVRIYVERDRVRWGKAAGVVAGVVGVLAALVAAGAYVVGAAVATVAANRDLVVGVLVLVAVVAVILRRVVGSVARRGACCAGLHCSGCPHR